MKKILLTLFLIPTVISCSQEVGDVPKELFGIKLGTIYNFSKVTEGDVAQVPIKKFTGANRFLGNGTHFYFEPTKESKYFPYKEKKKAGDDKFFQTNYRLYLLPVIPDSIKTIEELSSAKVDVEVALIEWSDEKKNNEESYYWTMEMCKTLSSNIKTKPEILDNQDSKNYFCTFKQDNRMLEIQNLTNSVYFKLQYDKEFFDKQSAGVDEKIGKLTAKDILKK